MSATGPNTASVLSPNHDLTVATAAVTVGAPDVALSSVFSAGYCRRVYCNGAGTLFVQRQDDAAPVAYTVAAGQVIDGWITLIGGTTNHPSASALSLVVEV